VTRSVRSTWNYLTALLFSAVSMVVALFVTPILLRDLGQARLGAARAVVDWTGYLSLLELGLGGALAPLLARELGREDRDGVAGLLAAGFRAYLRVALVMLGGGLVLAAIITRLVKIDPAYHRDLAVATLIAITPLLLMPLSPLRALAEASQRGYVVNLFLILQSIAIATCAVLLARAGWGISGQLVAVAIGAFLFGGLLVVYALRKYRRVMPAHLTRAPAEANRQLWQLNTPTLIINTCGRVGLLTDNIIIGSLLSASAIVPFFLTQRLAQLAQAQLQAVGSATWAGLAELHARGERELFEDRLIELTRAVTILGLIALVPIVAYNHAFVRLWVGEDQFAGLALTALAALNALIVSLAALWGWVFGGTGQLAKLVPLSVASAIFNIIVSVGFTWWYSHHGARLHDHRALLGPVLGTTTAYLLLTMPILPLLLKKHFGISLRQLAIAATTPMLLAIPYAAAVFWIAQHFPPLGWLGLVLHMSLTACVFAAMCWLLLLSADDRARWKLRLRLASGARAVA
jgi:O-antigen/teichoic acid export membrane protein